MPQLISRFHLSFVLEESEVVARKSSLKKVFLIISQISQKNICAMFSFAIKLQDEDLQLQIQNLVEVLPVNFAKSLRTSVLQTSARAYLWRIIFTRVSSRKTLGFYHKWNRQLFYYEGTLPYIPLKILEPVNRVIFRIPLSCYFLLYLSRQKHV